MALNKANLKADIKTSLDSNPTTKLISAQEIAAAYYSYASSATFGASVPTIPPSAESAMASTLNAAMVGVIVSFVAAFDTALAAFWAAVPVAGGSGTGVTAPPTLTVAASTLSATMTAFPTTDEMATGLSNALDASTKTVIATLTLPPAAPVPYPAT